MGPASHFTFPNRKSTATISTSNDDITYSSANVKSNSDGKQDLLQEFLLKGSAKDNLSAFGSTISATTTDTVSAEVSNIANKGQASKTRDTKLDLIELFDKFDVNSPVEKDQLAIDKVTRAENDANIEYDKSSDNSMHLCLSDDMEDEKCHEDLSTGEHNSSLSKADNVSIVVEGVQKIQKNEHSGVSEEETISIPDVSFNGPSSSVAVAPENEEPIELQPPSDFSDAERKSAQTENNKLKEVENNEVQDVEQQKNFKKNSIKVNPKEQYQISHRPFDFQHFLSRLKEKSATPIVRYIRSFLVSFNKQGYTFTTEQKIKILVDFKAFMNEKFALYEPFSSMDDTDLENSREGLEKLIMNRIYENTYSPLIVSSYGTRDIQASSDVQQDRIFEQQCQKYKWITGSHLDIDLRSLTDNTRPDFDFIESSSGEIGRIDEYKAPRDKIICILNCCKIIFSLIKASNQEANADSFIPLLILVIIHADLGHLLSNIHYIQNYRSSEWLSHGETSYYLSSLEAAISFISSISFESLTISNEEYEMHMKEWESLSRDSSEITDPLSHPIIQPVPIKSQSDEMRYSLSPSKMLTSGAELIQQSISSFLSSSPQDPHQVPSSSNTSNPTSGPTTKDTNDGRKTKETYKSLKELFPNLDSEILRDIILMNKGDLETSLDACLQLVSDD